MSRKRNGAAPLIALIALVAGAAVADAAPPWAAPPARAGSFTDSEARVFTLLDKKSGPLRKRIGRLRALPDGSLLFTRLLGPGPNLWRLHIDGRLQRLRWAGSVIALATERAGTALLIREGRTVVERVHLDARRRSRVADVARARGFPRQGFSRRALLAALDDGTILASDGRRLWQRGVNGRFGQLPSTGSMTAIAPLADGAFAVTSEGGKATRVAAGHRRPLAPGWDVEGGLAGFGAGDAVATSLRATEGQGPVLTIVRADGSVTRQPWNDDGTLGDGDGVAVGGMHWPTPISMTVAADGSLVFAAKRTIRAVVPPDSSRARIAITQTSYRSFGDGAVNYFAGRGGIVTLRLRQGTTAVALIRSRTEGGEGTLRLSRPPDRGVYDLRLQLRTRSGIAATRAHIDHRVELPLDEGEIAIELQEADSEGDEGGRVGTRVGQCHRSAPLVIGCLLIAFASGSGAPDGDQEPVAMAWAELQPDGDILTWQEPLAAKQP